jgi:hypothetical protein
VHRGYTAGVFEQVEERIVSGHDVDGTIERVDRALSQAAEVRLVRMGPAVWIGKGPEQPLGFVMKATVTAAPVGPGFTLRMKVEADLEDKGIAFLYLSWLFCCPAAPILFFLAWSGASSRRKTMFEATWAASEEARLPAWGWGGLPPGG